VSVKTKAGKTTDPPKFKSEAEEAEWWDRNPDFIADQFEKAAKEGRILRGLPGRGATRSVTIRLATKDVETAQALAAKMGLPYQTYIKTVLHQALERERNSPGR
jgi:predicted DNA binding CopG/RHH family protein